MRIRVWMALSLMLTSGLCAQFPSTQRDKYLFISGNYQFPFYSDPLKTRVRIIERTPNELHIPVSLEFGYFKPYSTQILLGGSFLAGLDRYSDYGNSFQIEIYQASVSAIYFMDEAVGSGMFIRGDAGPALVRRYSSGEGTEAFNFGGGLLVSSGFAVKYENISVMLSAGYSFKSAGSHSYQSIQLGLAALF